IQSLFGPHYGNMLGGMPMQPGLGETVVNNYYGDQSGNAPDQRAADYSAADYSNDRTPDDQGSGNDPGVVQADDSQDDTSSDFGGQDQDFGSDQDFGGDDSNIDV
ncbi:MAG: hypothetical protein ACREDL_19655, partial [Bradyrhizobium sp.]